MTWAKKDKFKSYNYRFRGEYLATDGSGDLELQPNVDLFALSPIHGRKKITTLSAKKVLTATLLSRTARRVVGNIERGAVGKNNFVKALENAVLEEEAWPVNQLLKILREVMVGDHTKKVGKFLVCPNGEVMCRCHFSKPRRSDDNQKKKLKLGKQICQEPRRQGRKQKKLTKKLAEALKSPPRVHIHTFLTTYPDPEPYKAAALDPNIPVRFVSVFIPDVNATSEIESPSQAGSSFAENCLQVDEGGKAEKESSPDEAPELPTVS